MPIGISRSNAGDASQVSPSILSVSWNPNGNEIALGLTDGTVRIFDPGIGETVTILDGHSEEVFAAEWNSDGTLIASGGPDSLLNIWDARSGDLIKSISVTSNTLPATIFSVSWRPDSSEVAVATDAVVMVYDAKTGTQLQSLLKHRRYVMSLVWDEKDRLVSGSWDGTIIVWDVITNSIGLKMPDTEPRTSGVETLDWHPADNIIASGHLDNLIRLWDTSSGWLLHAISSHNAAVTSVKWSPDGNQLASSSLDGSIHIWDMETELSAEFFSEDDVHIYDIAWNPNGNLLASGHAYGHLRIWDMETEEIVTDVQVP